MTYSRQLITFSPGTTYTSSWGNWITQKATELVSIDDFGAIGDGVTDDRGALLAALANVYSRGGGNVRLVGGKTYRVSSRVPLGDYPGCGIIGPRSATILAKSTDFTNSTITTRYTSNSAVLDFSGMKTTPYTKSSGFLLKGFTLRSEVADNRVVDAITAQNASDLEVMGLEIVGFPVGCGIKAASLGGLCIFAFNYIHGFTTASTWATQPQITGIEIDGDRINSTGSSGVRIVGNRISDLTMTGATLATYGMQTDGINLQGTYPNATTRCHIHGNAIDNVGEAIDCFGSLNTFTGNELSNLYDYGIKLVHGASNNVIDACVIVNPGRAGVGIFGSSIAGVGDTDRNVISDVTIVEVNPLNRAVSNPAAIAIEDNGGTAGKPRNTMVSGGAWSLGTYGQYGVCDVSTGNGNIVDGVAIYGGAGILKKIRVDNGASIVRLAGSNVFTNDDAATTLASAATITPIGDVHFVSGVAAINSINAPSRLGEGGQITLIPTGSWTTTTAGNIAIASTAVVGKAMVLTYLKTTNKWYPSY